MQREILIYMVSHPEAKDTVDGIMDWWLPRGPGRLRSPDVILALEDLAQKGWITVASYRKGATVYGLDKTRLVEIQEFLES